MANSLTLADAVASANTGLDAIKRAPIVEEDTGIKCIRIQDVNQEKQFSEWGNTEVEVKNFEKFQLKEKDILIARTGGSVGSNKFIDKDYPAVYNNGLIRIRVNEEKHDPKFIYYLMQTEAFRSHINAIAYSTSAQPNMKIKDFLRFEFKELGLKAEKSIQNTLSCLDKKIELNRQTNQTLEQMAHALFKSWFVDFDPVIDNALAAGNDIPEALQNKAEQRKQAQQLPDFKPLPDNIRALFPSEFEESEIGLIPKGWNIKPADEIADIAIGKTPPRKQKEWFSEQRYGNVVWVSIRDMGAGSAFIDNSSEYLTPESISKFNIKVVPKGSVILSFKMTLGRVCIASSELATNEAIAHFVNPKIGLTKEYIYSYLKAFDYNLLGSTSSIATAVNSKIIKKMPFLVPSFDIVQNFNDSLERIFSKKLLILEQSRELEKLRDTLLPKLISGAISLKSE